MSFESQYGTTGPTMSNTSVNISQEDYDIRRLAAANGIYDKRAMQWYNKFVRFQGADPYNALINAKEYLFFTKPDLHLISTSYGGVAPGLSSYAFFRDVIERYYPVCLQLQSSMIGASSVRGLGQTSPFMTILSNTVKNSLDLPDLEAENESETGANVYGTKITYRGNSYPSDQELSFSLEFEDTKYLEVYMLFKIYDEYCRYKNMGLIDLTPGGEDQRWINYTINKILHDQFSIYKFIVAEDGITILHFSRVVGVYPTGAPRSAFSDVTGQSGQTITVNFKGQFVRDMDPIILVDFNRISKAKGFNEYEDDMPLYDEKAGHMNSNWAASPYVAINPSWNQSDKNRMGKYQLRWKEW